MEKKKTYSSLRFVLLAFGIGDFITLFAMACITHSAVPAPLAVFLIAQTIIFVVVGLTKDIWEEN